MKRFISFFLSFFLVVGLFTTVFASEVKVITMVVDEKEVMINGESVFLDVPPTIVEGRTLVPLRFISEAFGAEVEWDGVTRTITLTAPDVESLQQIIDELQTQKESIEKANAALKTENTDLKNQITTLTEENETLSEKVGMMDTLITKLEDQIADLLNENEKLTKEVEELKKKLSSGSGQEDAESPVITVNNLSAKAILEEESLVLDVTIEDDSTIVFSRVFLNSVLLTETLGEFGEVQPSKLVSGEYALIVQAIDGSGNVGTASVPFTVKHDLKKEPIRFTLQAVDAGGMAGPGPRSTGTPTADSSMPYLTAHFQNRSMASYEIITVRTFDASGTEYQMMPGMNFFDIMKEQFGLPEHLMIVSGDKYSAPCAISLEQQNMTPEEFFDGWEVKITMYDSIRELEFIKTLSYSK
jgi:regulator of replication initiation timing